MNCVTSLNTIKGVVEKKWLVKGLTKEIVGKNISLTLVQQMLIEKTNGQNEEASLHDIFIHFEIYLIYII